jgi:tetratricopeptide (TPR) repeat protein
MTSSISSVAIALILFLLVNPVNSHAASGGGGGGGFSGPSQNAPSFDPVVKYQEGIAALQNGENRKAEKAFRKVISVNRKHASSQFFLGLALFEQEKFKKAKRPFEKALKYNDQLVLAHGYLGVVYQKTNKPKKVDQHRQQLLEHKAACGNCKNKAKIDQALLQLNGDTQQSLIELNSPKRGDQLYIEAVSSINQGDYLSALDALEKSASVFGPHPDILTYQGFANRKLGNRDLALEFYRSALSIDAHHRGANEYLGEYYVEIGRLDLARKQLEKLDSICMFGCEEVQELQRWINSAS